MNRATFLSFIVGGVLFFTVNNQVLHGNQSAIEKTITFIEGNQNKDGGWGYWPGYESYVEPTGLCLLALNAAGSNKGLKEGLLYLKKSQLDSGGIGINDTDKEGNWMSYAALLAFDALGASEEKGLLQEWILNFYDGYDNVPSETVESLYREFRTNMTIDGWPWFGNTNSWIEPTSLFITALVHTGVELQNKRIRSGLELLLDRTSRSGGWNYGNPFVKNTYLDAYPLSTSIALVAMGMAGYTENEPVVERALKYLGKCIGEEMSTVSLAWSLLSFKRFKTTQGDARKIAVILKKRQMPNGSFRENLLETALSYLALSSFKFGNKSMEIKK